MAPKPSQVVGNRRGRRHARHFRQQDQRQDQGHAVAHSSFVPSILSLLQGSIHRHRINVQRQVDLL